MVIVMQVVIVTKPINSTTEMATSITSNSLTLNLDVEKDSDDTDSDILSPRHVSTPVDTPMSIAGTPFPTFESQPSTVSSNSSEEVLVIISHDLCCVILFLTGCHYLSQNYPCLIVMVQMKSKSHGQIVMC